MSFAIARMEKVKSHSVIGRDKHNNRKNEHYSNKEIDPTKTYLNYDLLACRSYSEKIKDNIKKYYKGEKAVRSDANVGVEVIFTSDDKFFDELSPADQRKFFEKSLEFLKEFAGEKNIVGATVHMDESTPHMHTLFTPIDDEGRLRYRSFIDKKFDLIKFQDMYYDFISKDFPQLQRGESALKTKRKHLSTEDLKLKTANEKLEKEIGSKKSELETKNKQYEALSSEYSELEKNFKNKIIDVNELKSKSKEVLQMFQEVNTAIKKLELEVTEKKEKEKLLIQELEKTYNTSELERLEENAKKINDVIQEKEASVFGGYKFSLDELNNILRLNSMKHTKIANALKNIVNTKELQELKKKLQIQDVELKRLSINVSNLKKFKDNVLEIYPNIEKEIQSKNLEKWNIKKTMGKDKGLSR